MKKLILNVKKIKSELKRRGKTQAWLAERLGTSRQNVFHMLDRKPIGAAEKIGDVLEIEPKDLII